MEEALDLSFDRLLMMMMMMMIIFIIFYSSDSPSSLITESVCLVGKGRLKERCGLEPRTKFFRLRNRQKLVRIRFENIRYILTSLGQDSVLPREGSVTNPFGSNIANNYRGGGQVIETSGGPGGLTAQMSGLPQRTSAS